MRDIKNQNLIIAIGCSFLFLINTFPFKFIPIKVLLMAFMIFASMNLIGKYKNVMHPVTKHWFVIYILYGIFFSFVGYFVSPEQLSNIVQTLPINIFWPILYMLLIPLFSKGYFVVRAINVTLIFAASFIGFYILLGGLSFIGILPIPESFFINTVAIEGKYDASIQLADPSVTSLMYLIPYVFSYYILRINEKDSFNRKYVILALALTTIAMVISGRRALILNTLIAPVLLFLIVRFSKLNSDFKIKLSIYKQTGAMLVLFAITLIALVQFNLLNFDALQENFLQSFDLSKTSKDESSEIRGSQADGLLRSFSENPLFGTGLGTGSKYVIRSSAVAGSYELSYLAILFQSGIVGITIYLGLLLFLIWKMFKLISVEKKFIIPHLVGAVSFLMANASNPYLGAFDHLWTIFLPMGIINYCLTQNKKNGYNTTGSL